MSKNNLKNQNDRLSKHSKNCSSVNGKIFTKTVVPKKVIVSKKITFQQAKSCSTGVINSEKAKPKKTTKSEASFVDKGGESKDYCAKCGDYLHHFNDGDEGKETVFNIPKLIHNINSRIANNDRRKSIQEYYKNENFNISTNSINENGNNSRKVPLDTIKEDSEIKTNSSHTIFEIYDDSSNETDLDTEDNVKELKKFREKNYFECHSSKSRLKSKASVTSLDNHKCVYRFYLNDRLFPVPLNADYNGTVRCVECHLPMYTKMGDDDEKINGTIQAKVKLGERIQDLTLLLPVKDPLIIKERRKEETTKEIVYFGVIKLDKTGDSLFNRVVPGDSLALRYQKGYKELSGKVPYRYNHIEDGDTVII